MIYRENPTFPGFGYIEPIMDGDDPLIARDVAERIIAYQTQKGGLVSDSSKMISDIPRYACDCVCTGPYLDSRNGVFIKIADLVGFLESSPDKAEAVAALLDQFAPDYAGTAT